MKKNIPADHYDGNVLSFIPNAEFYFKKGVQAFQHNDLRNAEKYLKRSWQLEEKEPVIACQYAIVLGELEEYEKANEVLYKILNEIDPHFHDCHYFLANNFAYIGWYKEALYHAKKYLQLEPSGEYASDAAELANIVAYESDEQNSQILTDEDLYEEEIIILQDRAKGYLEEGKLQEAITKFDEIIKKYPGYWPAYNNLALAYYYTGDNNRAKEMLEYVLGKNPGNLHALCNLIIFEYYEGKDPSAASQALKKIHPISIDHRYKLGVTFCIIGHYEDGFRWLKSVDKYVMPNDGSFYYWYSNAAYYTGNEELAKRVWKKLLTIQPEKKGSEPWDED